MSVAEKLICSAIVAFWVAIVVLLEAALQNRDEIQANFRLEIACIESGRNYVNGECK